MSIALYDFDRFFARRTLIVEIQSDRLDDSIASNMWEGILSGADKDSIARLNRFECLWGPGRRHGLVEDDWE